VLRALVACAGKEALPDVRADLASDDPDAHNEACRAIVNLLGPDAVTDLVALAARTEGSHPLVPFTEGGGLSIPPDVLTAYLEALPPDQYSGFLLVLAAKVEDQRLQPVLRKIVLRLLASTDGSERTAAAMAGKLHVEEAWPHLIALLESPRAGTREAAKQALDEIRAYRELRASFEQFGEGGRTKALQDAKALLKSESAEKRRGAALAIGALGDPGGVPALLELLSDPDAAVRAATLQALERLGGKPN
jgi:HEAT repeat protein